MTPGLTKTTLLEAIAAAKAKLQERNSAANPQPTYGAIRVAEAEAAKVQATGHALTNWNAEQQAAIDAGTSGESFCIIGAAGTGKTTTLRGLLAKLLSSNRIPPLERPTKHLSKDSPGAVLVSYTRRAVRNIAKQMPSELKSHCITIHKLLEYAPEEFYVTDKDGNEKRSMRFAPQRNRYNPLPSNLRLIVVDESSMVSSELFELIVKALPSAGNVQWIFLGDLNQLPPVYGDAILGNKLLSLKTIELTQVYRQALESPIIELALQIKDNKIPKELQCLTTDWEKVTPRGKVTLRPWKRKLDQEDGMYQMQRLLRQWVRDGFLDFENDVILCPWNKAFGTIELNAAIATEMAIMRGAEVYEIIAGFEKKYFSIGDRILVDKRDAIITKISRNLRYIGKPAQPASKTLDYWGWTATPTVGESSLSSEEDLDALLDAFADSSIEDRTHEASHAIHCKFIDNFEEETILSKSGEINATELAYCMSVHKSQGSEWRRVFVITHDCHTKMLSRELVYTAFTRASEELYVILAPMALTKAAARPRIKGDTLREKLKYFQGKMNERQRQQLDEGEDE